VPETVCKSVRKHQKVGQRVIQPVSNCQKVSASVRFSEPVSESVSNSEWGIKSVSQSATVREFVRL